MRLDKASKPACRREFDQALGERVIGGGYQGTFPFCTGSWLHVPWRKCLIPREIVQFVPAAVFNRTPDKAAARISRLKRSVRLRALVRGRGVVARGEGISTNGIFRSSLRGRSRTYARIYIYRARDRRGFSALVSVVPSTFQPAWETFRFRELGGCFARL